MSLTEGKTRGNVKVLKESSRRPSSPPPPGSKQQGNLCSNCSKLLRGREK